MAAVGLSSAATQLLTAAVLTALAATCHAKSCLYSFGNITIDLAHLNLHPATSKDGSEYFYNPCYSDPQVFIKECAGSVICKKDSNWENTPLGVDEINKGFDTTTSELKLTYVADAPKSGCEGDKRHAYVTVACDESVSGLFEYQSGDLNCNYTFSLKTRLACVAAKSHRQGLSTGSILLILLLVCIAVYLVGGVLYKRIAKGAQGVEQIPNIEFWRSVPGLVMDGCRFVTRPCRGTSRYEQI